jgi:hypothetical protein
MPNLTVSANVDTMLSAANNAAILAAIGAAPTVSPALTGTPTAPTATAGTNTTQVATTSFVGTAIANLVASSPAALDTLNELATALGNDANFASTMTTALSTKATVTQLNAIRRVFGITIDGAGSVPAPGLKGYWRAPAVGVIKKVTLISDIAGAAVIDVWRDSFANYPPTVADTITAAAKPTLSSSNKAEDATLTGWSKNFAAGDVFGFNLDSITTCTKLTLSIEYEAT